MRDFELKFNYEPKEIAKAFKVHFSRQLRFKRDLIISLVLAVAGVLLWAWQGFSIYWIGVFGLAFMFALSLLVMYFIIPNLMKKREPQFADDYSITFTNTHIQLSAMENDVKVEWKDYDKVVESPEFFLLYYEEEEFSIIPKRVIGSESDVDEFRAMLKRKIGDRSKRPKQKRPKPPLPRGNGRK